MPLTYPSEVIVIKQNLAREETWRYQGKVIEQTANTILLEAFFNRPDKPFHGVLLAEGDRFVERYYTDRWYNIFEIHDKNTDALKAWYCNVTYPAIFEDGVITYVDLALDLLVYADGRHLVLDEDEFLELKLGEEDTLQARNALTELQKIFEQPNGFRLG